MKKSIIALIAAAAVVRVACLAMFGVYLYIQWFHYTFIVNANYVEYSESNDDFVLKTKEVVYDDGLRAVTFYVEDADGKRVYECGDAWRLWDFKGVHFQTGSNNIIVESGDIETVMYKYRLSDGVGVWEKTECPGIIN